MLKGIFLFFIFLSSAYAIDEPFHTCASDIEWHPFYYKNKEQKIQGAMIELFDNIFQSANIPYDIKLIPWKRCQSLAANYTENTKFAAAAVATFTLERSKIYYYTMPLYTIRQGIFYSKTKFPNINDIIKKTSDLNNYTVCGILGYNYDIYSKNGLTSVIDTNSHDIKAALEKTNIGRCDFLLANLEPIYYAAATKNLTIPPSITSMELSDLKRSNLYILVAKNYPEAYEVITKINQAILILQESGLYDDILTKYIPGYKKLNF